MALPAAGWMLSAMLLGGCFLHTDAALAPPDPVKAADDRTDKPKDKAPKKLPEEAAALRDLARHVDAADDPRFTEAAQSRSFAVRIEALRAWAASKKGPLPQIVIDLRSDDDPRVRAEALAMLAARKNPDAADYVCAALHDVELSVRLAAVRALGELDDKTARAELAELLKDRAELIRAEAVSAIAAHGSQSAVLAAARDPSWRVRLKVAAALVGYANADGAAAARRLLNDPSAEVERQVVRSVASWPLEMAVPVLIDALARDAVSVRKLAATQLDARWPAPTPGGAFPSDAPPSRRAEALAELKARYQREFGAQSTGFSASAAASSPQGGATADIDRKVEQLVNSNDFTTLAAMGPDVVAALERLAIDRGMTLPDPIYHEVLPRRSPVFAALDHLPSGDLSQRRRAADEFAAAARIHPPGRLATARLCALMTTETDAVVWVRALDAIENEASEPAARLTRLALSQTSGDVRRRACNFLAAHPDPANETFLLPLLNDPEQGVVLAAIRALGATGRITNVAALKNELASPSEDVQLAAAIALARLHDSAGDDAILRLSYSRDVRIRGELAQGLGDLGDDRFVSVLVRLLDDSKATVSHAALASLPRVAGRNVTQSADGTDVSTSEQIARWKKWYADKQP
jgi:HEAT repeat protein